MCSTRLKSGRLCVSTIRLAECLKYINLCRLWLYADRQELKVYDALMVGALEVCTVYGVCCCLQCTLAIGNDIECKD